ncbi:RNA polymerase sigma factor RpoD/SigA [bacterium]|nr:RNA polymerase sigma factor RpoD/SigA [bacterium]
MSSEELDHSAQPSPEEASLQLYLKEIGKYPLLTKEEEYNLATKARRGDTDAFRLLIKSNLRFVVNVAKKYQTGHISLLDLINDGNIGLIEAAKRYDPDKGTKFITYAIWWIRQSIMQALAGQSGAVRLPIKQAGLLYRIGEKYRNLKQDLRRDPTIKELADSLDMQVSAVEPILRASRFSVSLETPQSSDSSLNLITNLPDIHQVSASDLSLKSTLLDDMNRVLDKLTPREREILQLHYGLGDTEPLTLEEIGQKFGLTRERIRQIESRAKKKIMKMIDKDKLKDYLN